MLQENNINDVCVYVLQRRGKRGKNVVKLNDWWNCKGYKAVLGTILLTFL